MHPEVTVSKSPKSLSITMSIVECSLKVASVSLEFLQVLLKIVFLIVKATLRNIIPKSKKDLSGEIVLITGSAQGVGRQLAKDIAKLGAKVVLWDINEEKVKETAAEIKSSGDQAWWYVCDVTSENEIKAKAQVVAKEVGDVTILVNNAGIMQNLPLLDLNSDRIKMTFAINILAHFWTIRAFLPKMVENNYGHIVAISSAAGLMGHVNQSDYSASKFAVVGMMESLCEELRLKKCNVALTTICPLTVDTGLNRHPVSRFHWLTPILSIEDASRQIVNAIRREEFLVGLPRRSQYILRGLKLFPHQVTSEIMDLLEYCRISNAVPTASEAGAK